LTENEHQVIPTAWIEAAQARWRPGGMHDRPMTAIGVDLAGGGNDSTVISARYGAWYAPLIRQKGAATRDGNVVAGAIVMMRRNNCPVILDVGGGYGGAATIRLRDNGITAVPFNGARASTAKTRDGALSFVNMRAQAWWRFREELDPGQHGGSYIALPRDASIKADLSAPRWHLTARGIQIEEKSEIRKRLGRSPDDGDAIVMCMEEGARAAASMANWQGRERPSTAGVGYAEVKAMYRRRY
jgi:hypothetical protein